MDVLLYLILGFIDILAILALIFKIFRFPFWEYIRKHIVICTTLALVSFVMRLVLGFPEFDTGLQFILLVLFLRYLLKLRSFEANMLATIGVLSFDLIQIIAFKVLQSLHVATLLDVKKPSDLVLIQYNC